MLKLLQKQLYRNILFGVMHYFSLKGSLKRCFNSKFFKCFQKLLILIYIIFLSNKQLDIKLR